MRKGWKWGEGKRGGGGVAGYEEEAEEGGRGGGGCWEFDSLQPPVGQPEEDEGLWGTEGGRGKDVSL